MISALLLRFGIPRWLAELGLVLTLLAGAVWYQHYLIEVGVTREATRRDKIDADKSKLADQVRDAINARIRGLQSNIATARAELAASKTELNNEKAISTQRQSDLLAGRQRERVLIAARPRPVDPNGQVASPTAGVVDTGTSTEVDLDPGVASWLEGVRADHNAAVKRLAACIASYDSVKAAADAMP